MTFSEDAWNRNADLIEAIRTMPFNRDLATGRLEPDRFRQYIVQDAHYLVAFGQALAMAAAKADDPDRIVQFAESAAGAITVERGLHTDYFHRFGLSAAAVAATPVSPACHHYTCFLLATAFREPLPVLLAAMLPCFWVYREVGHAIAASAVASNPYRAWIDTYGGDEFGIAVDRMMLATDASVALGGARTVDAMHVAFTRATQLEWMFWDSADRLEQWPV